MVWLKFLSKYFFMKSCYYKNFVWSFSIYLQGSWQNVKNIGIMVINSTYLDNDANVSFFLYKWNLVIFNRAFATQQQTEADHLYLERKGVWWFISHIIIVFFTTSAITWVSWVPWNTQILRMKYFVNIKFSNFFTNEISIYNNLTSFFPIPNTPSATRTLSYLLFNELR